jgi:predicted phosphoadenosine phosphosulfate sulfurtransferase
MEKTLIKKYLDISVLEAAKQRISFIFDKFPKISVSFSGGKDSTVLLHLVMEEAIKRNRKVGVLFIDWEVQYSLTIKCIRECIDMYASHIELHWVCLPLSTLNACSQFETEWICWDPAKKHLWVREMPPEAISDQKFFPFYYYPMTFEEFVPKYSEWYSGGELTACFIGIRTQESLNRFRSIANVRKVVFEGKQFTTQVSENVYNAYPIYDWKASDDWKYNATSGKPYNKIYDLMFYSGLTIHQMRICEMYGNEQKHGLYLCHLMEPALWSKVVARVAGANNGALYANEPGMIMGNSNLRLPDGHTWRSYLDLLLSTMPEKTAEHYRCKISVWHHFYTSNGVEIKDYTDNDIGGKDNPSWRRVVKTILMNDYWCKSLGFGPTKVSHYEKYVDLIKRKRKAWKEGI